LFTSNFPNEWKQAKVTPIFKDGDKSDVSNYRPISVLSVVSKIIERAVHDQLYSYLTNANILSPSQSGFRSGHSTNSALIDVSDYILENMNNSKVTAAIFLDLKKAFDTVSHNILISKLSKYGINGSALKWFISYLSNRSQIVSINSSYSDPQHINIGVPQGSILGPLLFIIYVNSLPDCVTCKCIMYADDTTLLCSSSDPACLQSELDANMKNIAKWFESNMLTINIKKTKLMVFGTQHILSNFTNINLSYNSDSVEKVDSFKYLGVIFDPYLKWCDHTNYISSCISKRIGVIRRIKYFLPKSTVIMLASALVMPYFDYCSCGWSNCNVQFSNDLQVLQNRLARILLSADIMTPIRDLLNSLNWKKLSDRWNDHLLLLTFKCLQGIAPSYLSSKFTFTDSIHSKGTRSQTFKTLVVPSWRNTQGKRTFHYRASQIWNELPSDIRYDYNTMSLNVFKHIVKT
jgi:hypothetical protein